LAGLEEGAPLNIGVLALQGGFEAHVQMLRSLGASVTEVRAPEAMGGLDGLVIPGGESTTIAMGMKRDGLDDAVRRHAAEGGPVLGTCAGMIVCDRGHLGLIDVTTQRNAYGRQRQSFEADVEIDGIGSEALRGVFIRAPRVSEVGSSVETLARYGGDPVVIRDGDVLASTFHPELTDDSRLHALFMAMVTARKSAVRSPQR
jgi:5'-phosphate synthase pdxT subunit